jgi:antirestriction protein
MTQHTETVSAFVPSSSAALSVFIGLYVAPAFGRWVPVDGNTDAGELHEIGAAIAAKYNALEGYAAAEEYGIFDTDCEVPGVGRFIREGTAFDTVCTIGAALDELSGDNLDAFGCWLANESRDLGNMADLIESFRGEFVGEFDDLEDYARQYVDDCDMLRGVPELVQQYFDFGAFGRDAELGGDIWTARAGGSFFVFQSN